LPLANPPAKPHLNNRSINCRHWVCIRLLTVDQRLLFGNLGGGSPNHPFSPILPISITKRCKRDKNGLVATATTALTATFRTLALPMPPPLPPQDWQIQHKIDLLLLPLLPKLRPKGVQGLPILPTDFSFPPPSLPPFSDCHRRHNVVNVTKPDPFSTATFLTFAIF
jgi:hypothetical protein